MLVQLVGRKIFFKLFDVDVLTDKLPGAGGVLFPRLQGRIRVKLLPVEYIEFGQPRIGSDIIPQRFIGLERLIKHPKIAIS